MAYPTNFAQFTTKRNTFDTIDASDPNSIQSEVLAIENAIGLNPALSSAPSSTDVFIKISNQFQTLNDRLNNIESGIVGDSHTQYIRRTGNEAIINTAPNNIPLIIQGANSQSGDLQRWISSTGVVLASVSANGTFNAKSVVSTDSNNAIVVSIFGT